MSSRTAKSVVVCAAAAALLLVAAPTSAADKSDVVGRVQNWQASFNEGQAGAVAAQYTADATRMPYQAPALKGHAAIKRNIEETYALGIVKIELEVAGAESEGNMAWAHGTYVLKGADGTTMQQGKWMNVSKKVEGSWLIQADIWNTDGP